MNIDSLNPYPTWRAGQREACQAIVEAVQSGQRIITYKGPTGSGKSLVLSVAARALLEEGTIKRATYTTPQRQLVHQLAGDERLGITALLGRANYPCHKMPQGSAGDCPVPAKARRKTCPRCPYLAARDAYVDASVGATTLDKLLTDRSLPPAELLIVDESQGLEMKLIEQRSIILPEWMDLTGDLPEQM
ncbi:MAG TPA: AAA family ATPase, partial [Methanothrix sp.]|nr:AAA family ATPase [Methanothrix sp.]